MTVQFTDFTGVWSPLCLAKSVKPNRPLGLHLAGERVVLFRDTHGTVRALRDQCPHRGVALSLGTVTDGEITCPFHGWRFNGEGQCLHVPWNPQAKRDNLAVEAFPIEEKHGIIWIFSGPKATTPLRVPPVLSTPNIKVTAQSFDWNVHWTRVMENMLDAPHLPFVHAKTIGKRLRNRTDKQMEMQWHDTDYGGDIITLREGEASRNSLRFHFPNTMEMIIDPGGRTLRLLAVCTPTLPNQTRLTIYTIRNFAKARVFDPLFARANTKVAAEDKDIIESSLPIRVPPAREEVSVPSDAPTLAFRKIWFTRLKDSHMSASSPSSA